jgi:uncharacterized protein YprB with RNaseH-like and TPR domain
VLRLTQRLPLSRRHGRCSLSSLTRPLRHLIPGGQDWLCLDTETSGLAGGSGTLAFLVGLVRLQEGQLWLRQYLLTGYSPEPALWALLAEELRGGETLVSYNGKSFDLPLVATRCSLNRCPNPWQGMAHLDLLYLTRRLYAATWPDCRLATAEQRLLGLERSGDLPGAEVPRVWRDWLRHGRRQGLRAVLRHNQSDLLSLALLLPALDQIVGGDQLAPPRTTPVGANLQRWQLLRQALGADRKSVV